MTALEEKFEDWLTGWNNKGGPALPAWLNSIQVDGWMWDGTQPQMEILADGTPVLRHRFVR
ncbi:hypothetical protein [Actinophytocola sp.]|uniref:hypothetical protein n=1 Tax=Actinophytocola sp. TaxID=1872138 RepID=UPI003D6C06E4